MLFPKEQRKDFKLFHEKYIISLIYILNNVCKLIHMFQNIV